MICPTCADAKPDCCCSCGHLLDIEQGDEFVLQHDPYANEINDDDSLHLQCENCLDESRMGI